MSVDRWQRLADASLALDQSVDHHAILDTIVRMAIPVIADYCALALVGPDGATRWGAAAHRNAERQSLVNGLCVYAPRDVATEDPVLRGLGRSSQHLQRVGEDFLRDIAHDATHLELLRDLAPLSYMSVPLIAHGEARGALVFMTTHESGRRFSTDDLEMATAMSHRAALALDRARRDLVLQESVRARDTFLAAVSHDLRDPLSNITMAAEFILDDLLPPETASTAARRQVEAIRRSADRMQRLVGDLLDAAAMDAGHLRMVLATEPVMRILMEAHELLEVQAAASGVLLTVVSSPALEVHADRGRLLQVFANVGGNAIKFTPSGGRVELRASRQGDAIVFEVMDTGPGIAADQLPHVFDRFWQARGTKRHGRGLGLTIAKGIVEAHGGQIFVTSAPGRGCAFRFTIPVVASPERSQ